MFQYLNIKTQENIFQMLVKPFFFVFNIQSSSYDNAQCIASNFDV